MNTIADHVDSDLREHMLARGGAMPVRRRVLAAIDGHAQSEYLVRVARRIAERRDAPWSVAFVDTGAGWTRRGANSWIAALRAGAPARRRGDHPARRTRSPTNCWRMPTATGVGQIVLGRTRERPLARMFSRSLTQQLLRRGAHLELTIIATPGRAGEGATPAAAASARRGSRGEYLYATLATLVAFGLAFAGRPLPVGWPTCR